MTMILRARVRILAAIAAGVAGCHESKTNSVELPAPLPSAGTSGTSETATADPAPTPRPRVQALKCPDYAKAERFCVAPHTPPSTGGNVPAPGPYTSWDDDGCYQGHEIVSACNGISAANGPIFAGGQCCFDICRGTPAPCGRPLMIDGEARVASIVSRSGWSAPDNLGLEPRCALGERAARAWADDAALEHASIAAFARLSLELMALGAPSDLVAAAHRAALEEIEHARACFGIAAELSGDLASLGPAPLSLDGVVVRGDLAAVAREAAAQSCVGETVAALSLARAAEQCGSDSLGQRLSRMAEQELSHAALGWQIVAWACASGDATVRDAVRGALAVREHDAPAISDANEADDWRRLGRLTRADMRHVVRDARELVGEACARLFAYT